MFNLFHYFFRDLNEDPRTIRKRVEKDKVTDKDWATFKQNPARFTQVRSTTCSRSFSEADILENGCFLAPYLQGIPESGKFLLINPNLGNFACGIRNPTNEWNAESKIH